MNIQTFSVIGLGSMGLGAALSIKRAGHQVFGADPAAARIALWQEAGGMLADPTRDAPLSDAVISVVLNADQTRQVFFGPDGWARHMRKGATIVSCATVAPAVARELEALAKDYGLYYLDAPISGGAVKAAQGQLSIMASGAPEAFDGAEAALSAMAAVVHRLGDMAGPGSAMKSVNQLLAGVHIAAMAEALGLAVSQGLDLTRVLEVISASAGNSWMFENRAPHVIDADYSPRSSVNIWPKDLGIISDIARDAGLNLPLTKSALDQFRAAAEAGFGHEDDAAVSKIVAQSAGLSLPGDA